MKDLTKHKKTQAAQIYLPIDMYIEVKEIAKSENKAMAQWIRDLVKKEVNKKKGKRKNFTDLPKFTWTDVDPNLSENLDEVIYKI